MKRMKKGLIISLVLVLLFSTGCAGTGVSSAPADSSTPAVSSAPANSSAPEASSTPASSSAPGIVPEFLEVFSGSMGGSWYSVGSEIATALQEKIPGLISSVAPGGGAANPTTINNKEGLLGLVYTGVAYEAYQGVGEYTEEHSNLSHVISLYSMPFIWVTLRSETSINTVYDIGDKRISPGRTGQTGLAISQACLAVHGIDMDKITENGGTVSLLGDSERLNMLRDRNLDAVSGLLPLDHSELQSLSISPGIKLITMDQAKISELQQKIPGLEAITIDPGTFDSYQTEPIYTVAAITSLVCHKELDEELVYNITKVVYEEYERLNKYFAPEDNVIITNPLAGVDKDFPIHPGAMKFYQEKGLI